MTNFIGGVGNLLFESTVEIAQNTETAFNNISNAFSSANEIISPEQQYFIGRAVAANILSDYNLYTRNPALNTYLNLICQAIVINSPVPEIYSGYHVAILETSEINAFATSGGHIFVSQGLITAAGSEDALAAVIAHEIAHIQLQHGIRAIGANRLTEAFMVTGASIAGVVSGYDVNEVTNAFSDAVGDVLTTMVNRGYSRNQENSADALALHLLIAAGYNPSGLIEMLEELNFIRSRHSGGFNRTHPTPARRLSRVQREMRRLSYEDTSINREQRFDALFPSRYSVTATALNVRSGPSASHSILGTLNRGDIIHVREIVNGWARFKFNGRNVYVNASYLAFAGTR